MQHLDEGTIHSWLDGALSAEEAARVDSHVKECPQCQATVAEARGFIAASSRILTALDNVPDRVVPAKPAAKSRNWPVWRAAAAVVIVALGTLVVSRERGTVEQTKAPIASSDTNVADQTAASAPTSAAEPRIETSTPKRPMPSPTRAVTPQLLRKGTNEESSRRTSAAPAVQTPAPPAMIGSAAGSRADSRDEVQATGATGAAAPSAQAFADPRTSQMKALDAAKAPLAVRLVATPNAIGERRMVYEVAPGDTVTLAETLNMQLSAVVVTGTGTTTTQSANQSAAAQPSEGSARKSVAVADSQRKIAPMAGAPSRPRASVTQLADAASSINTITWIDPATGNRMRLSGRHSQAELEEIRRRIEQVRAAEAAEKKTP